MKNKNSFFAHFVKISGKIFEQFGQTFINIIK